MSTEWTSKEVAAVVRAAQHEAGIRIAQAIEAECENTEKWPEVGHLRALRAAAAVARAYSDRIEV